MAFNNLDPLAVAEQYINEVLLQDYKRRMRKPVIVFVPLYENCVV